LFFLDIREAKGPKTEMHHGDGEDTEMRHVGEKVLRASAPPG